MSEPDFWIPFGTLTRAHGVRGEVRLVHHNPTERLPAGVARLRLCREGTAPRVVEVSAARAAKDATLVRLAGVEDRDAAQALAGTEVEVAVTDLPPLREGEFYLHELIGARAEGEGGAELGQIEAVVNLPGGEALALRRGGGEVLVPLREETVQTWDREGRRVVLRIPDGLLE